MQKSGYTLVELSMVVVVIALLVGGVLAGKSIIRSSELRSIAADVNKYRTALNSFRDKYDSLPGDMENAINYWGAAHTTPATCQITDSTGKSTTCNGDGNNHITDNSTTNNYESFRAWQQLAIAGFIPGKNKYSGISVGGSSTRSASPDINVPAGKIKGTGYSLFYIGMNPGGSWVNDTYNHVILFGLTTSGADTNGAALIPSDLMNLDTKMDDGRPLTGAIMTWIGTTCTTNSTPASSEYALSEKRPRCNLIYKLGF